MSSSLNAVALALTMRVISIIMRCMAMSMFRTAMFAVFVGTVGATMVCAPAATVRHRTAMMYLMMLFIDFRFDFDFGLNPA